MKRILAVDDHDTSLQVLRMLLTREGYDVTTASQGVEALEKARANPPDLVVADIQMPIMDGFALLRRWKEDPALGLTPFIVLSGNFTDPEDRELAEQLGADAFLLKGSSPDDLIRSIPQVLARFEADRERAARRPNFADDALQRKYVEALARKLTVKTRELDEANRSLREEAESNRVLASVRTAILDALPAQIALLDREATVVCVNEAWRRFVPRSVLQSGNYFVGWNYLAVCEQAHGECAQEAKEVAAGIRQVLSGDLPAFSLEYPCHSPTERRWFRVTVTPVSVSGPVGAVVMQMDETRRKLAEERLLQAEQQYRLLFQGNPQAMWVYDVATLRFLAVNRTALQQYGFSESEFLSLTLRDISPEQDLPNLEADLMQAEQSEFSTSVWRHKTKDGRVFPVEISSNRIEFEGRSARIVLAIDITQRVDAELELARLSRAQWLLSQCNQILIHVDDEQALLNEICRISVQDGGYTRAWVGLVEQDAAKSIIPAAFVGQPVRDVTPIRLTWDENQPGGHLPSGICARTGQIIFSEDVLQDKRFPSAWRAAVNPEIRSLANLPLCDNGRVFGVFGQYSDKVIKFGDDELRVLKELSEDLAFGILQLRQRKEKQRLEAMILRVATAVSAIHGEGFFTQLMLSMADLLGAKCAAVARIQPDAPTMARTLTVVLDGEVVDNFDYSMVGSCCEGLLTRSEHVIPDDAIEFAMGTPTRMFNGRCYVGKRLQDSQGKTMGVIFLLFERPAKDVGLLFSVLRIFAERSASELEREERDAQMRKQASILRRTHDAIIVRTLDQKVAYWNEGAERLYGWKAEEALGRPIADLLYVYEPALMEVHNAVMEVGEWRGQIVHKCRDGQLITVETHWTLLRDDKGEPEGIVSSSVDVTARQDLEERLRQTQRLESIGQLSGGIAHDFNNLLTVILGGTELLEEYIGQNERAVSLLAMTRTAANRGADLTREMLAFSRRQTLQPRVMNVSSLLEASRQMLKRALHERIDLRIIPASDLWTALVDPAQLENALLNLSINARDAMPDGGLLTIETANCTLDQEYADQNPGVLPGQYVRISLTDTGMGIPPEHIERIFEPFFTTKEVGKGTGLGLSMVYGFIKQSGGHIKVYSELEHGTCFKLYLPKAGDMAEAADLPSLDEEIQTGSGTVLVVEDEAMLREIARSHLASLGFTAILAGDSAEALQALELNPEIDLLFTDVMLPGTRNGRELAEEIRRIRPEIKVVFTSGYPENATNAVEPLGPSVHWLAKPYTKRELARILQSALTREDH